MDGQQNHPQRHASMHSPQHAPGPFAQHHQARRAVTANGPPNEGFVTRQHALDTPAENMPVAVDERQIIHIRHQEGVIWGDVVLYTGLKSLLYWLSDNLSRGPVGLTLPPREDKLFILEAKYLGTSAQSVYKAMYKNVYIDVWLGKTPREIEIRPAASPSMWALIKEDLKKGTSLDIEWNGTVIYNRALQDNGSLSHFYLQSKKAKRPLFLLGMKGDVERFESRSNNGDHHDPIIDEAIWQIIRPNLNSASFDSDWSASPYPSV
ncbi:hypothetical protein DFH06DRAFT_1333730 [Mycena polygramma]|nr:hypothetical protein DFH06DRAFT_1333730 [Mycena polygramma]